MASTKALDALYHVTPSETVRKIRELFYMAFFVTDHTTHFYALGGPDFIVGPDAPAEQRSGGTNLLASSRRRLELWEIGDDEIRLFTRRIQLLICGIFGIEFTRLFFGELLQCLRRILPAPFPAAFEANRHIRLYGEQGKITAAPQGIHFLRIADRIDHVILAHFKARQHPLRQYARTVCYAQLVSHLYKDFSGNLEPPFAYLLPNLV